MGPEYYRSVIQGQYHLVNRPSETQTGVMPAKDTPLVAARRTRLREWIDTQFDGSQTAFIARTKLNQGMLSALLKPDGKSFGEKAAANLESIAGMPAGYLVKSLDPVAGPSQTGGLDYRTLQIALVAVQKASEAADVVLDLYAAAPAIAFAYLERSALPEDPSDEQLDKFDQDIIERLELGVLHGEWRKRRTTGAGKTGVQAGKAKKASNRGR